MWIIVRLSDNMVVGTNYTTCPPTPLGHAVKEWYGSEPAVYDPETGEGDTDPTLVDPDYALFTEARTNLENIEDAATDEIAWLLDAIAEVDGADLTALRTMFKRVLQEQLREIRAWRYVIRRLM